MNEFFRVTINDNPVGDAEYLGDRSLVSFITTEDGIQKLYFSVYNYDFYEAGDSVSETYEVVVTGKLTEWFYVYMAYSVE